MAPLVYEAKHWRHGVLVGAGVASETTAAAVGAVGVVRRDPMAMKPFCGFNFADYWQHWLDVGENVIRRSPKIFHVNWFRQDADGAFLWPGFGENLRVLRWIIDRCKGVVEAKTTPIGYLPHAADIDTRDLDIQSSTLEKLVSIDESQWVSEMEAIGEYLQSYGERLPQELADEQARILGELKKAS